MAIPYRTAKFTSANILAIAILGSTAKFNSLQYFRLYGILRNKYALYHNSPVCECTLIVLLYTMKHPIKSYLIDRHNIILYPAKKINNFAYT